MPSKTPATIYYLEAARVILELRQSIVEGEWDEVRRITQQHSTRQDEVDLPATAQEEISAVREGLAYQDCMVRYRECASLSCAFAAVRCSRLADHCEFASLLKRCLCTSQ